MTCLSITVLPEKELRATALMKSSEDAAAQVAKRRAIPRLVAEAINLDFALSESLQINKLPAQTLNLYCIYLLYLPSFTHLLTYIYILPKLLSGTQVLWQVDMAGLQSGFQVDVFLGQRWWRIFSFTA